MPGRFLVQETYAPLKRAESNKFTLPLIVYVPFITLYLVYGSRPHDLPLVGGYFPTPTVTPALTSQAMLPNFDNFLVPTATRINYVLLPTFETPTPNYPFGDPNMAGFPFVKDLGDYYLHGQQVLFSYYYPPLGGTNCHEDNWVNGQCKDITASKEGWKAYVSKGIAVHPDMLGILPFGSIVYVVEPVSIRGFYTVVDLCGGCLINGNYYFDFLFPEMPKDLNWSKPVNFIVARVGWDNTFPPTSTPVLWTSTPTITLTISPSITPWVITATQEASNTPVLSTETLTPSFTPEPSITPVFTETPTP